MESLIDHDYLTELLGADPVARARSALHRVVFGMVESVLSRISRMEKILAEGGSAAVAREAHALRGMLASFGFKTCAERLAGLEESADQTTVESLRTFVEDFIPLLEKSARELAASFPDLPGAEKYSH